MSHKKKSVKGSRKTVQFTLDTLFCWLQCPRGKCLSVRSVTSSTEHCPFQNEKVKGCLRQFFSMLPFADPQAEAHGSTEKNKPLTISFLHFQSHPRGSKLHCISGEIHARIYPLDKWLATCYIMCSGYIASSLNG